MSSLYIQFTTNPLRRVQQHSTPEPVFPLGMGVAHTSWRFVKIGLPHCRCRRSLAWSLLALGPVVAVDVVEHVLAGQLGVEARADEEGAAHLAVQRVGLLGRRGQSLLQHDRDQVVDALGGALRAEVERLFGGEGLPQDHHRVHVGVNHGLGERGKNLRWVSL